ncbi:MAG: UvrD-helicase domain-containing protein [Crocinitomicaceae bacterium]|nr:UvrD-helicase domain-containing protein [Crocinitomicaceae bacterium]
MIEQTPKPLQILNASAGSGKTYQLVKTFIQLLITEKNNTTGFANVIAMTFTNKAALEMRERIIVALDRISHLHDLKDSDLKKSLQLTGDIAEALHITNNDVQDRCKRVLVNILHQYEDFHVMTIDKFNLRLIKAFGRDLDLPNDFEVVLDEAALIEQVVDDLLNQLGKENSETLSSLVMSYAKANIDEGDKWSFKTELVKFSAILRDEKNSGSIEQLSEMDFSPEQFRRLMHSKKQFDAQFLVHTNVLKLEVDSAALDQELLPGKSTTLNAILKVIGFSGFSKEPPFSEAFIKNLSIELKPKQVYPQSIKDKIQTLITFWEENLNAYTSLALFLKNFFNMALLQLMSEALKKVRQDEQLIRISEFNELISTLIKGENTPFIYERLGNKFHHFLLDEFQDTSRLQWLNLVPLVKESMSQNNKNLIVGDPKQSIYRFKNGIAEQFVALPKIYNPEKDPHISAQSDYFEQMGELSELKDNWRSSPIIVRLNETFFSDLRTDLPPATAAFYNSVHQTPKSTINGKVEIISAPGNKSVEELAPQIIDWIEGCRSDGFKLGEICLLGGTNKECNQWALTLDSAGYKVVSTDSLLINRSLKVQLTIAFLRRRLNPSGESEMKQFAELFFRVTSGSYNDYQSFTYELKDKHGKTRRRFDDKRFLANHFGGSKKFFFKHENLYDLIQQFYAIVGFNELEDPYLHHLADLSFDYGLSKGPNLRAFLKDYDTKKNTIAVQVPESDDAIQVMTIHKSKGLEFPVVILPKVNFSNEVKSQFLIPIDDYIIYKSPTSKEHLDVLKNVYDTEYMQITADNVNRCYVAMTRPIERLYISNFFKGNHFGARFHKALEKNKDATLIDDILTLSYSDGERSAQKQSSRNSGVFPPKNVSDHLWFPDISLQDNKDLMNPTFLSKEMQFGVQFHYLASIIENKNDIDKLLTAAIQEGTVSQHNLDELNEKLNVLFENNEYEALFKGATRILNEQAFIVNETTVLRPDKIILKLDETIIIDYKTGVPKPEDEKQVREYRLTLADMDYPNVKGYLFYTSLDELKIA